MLWRGLVLALSAAFAHSAIDVIRKYASASIAPDALVTLVAIVDAMIACSAVFWTGGLADLRHLQHPKVFITAVLSSSVLLLFAKFCYQRALSISPISLTVPYLSFTPAVLLLTAFLLLGEVPSFFGVCGVTIVAFGGYLLSLRNTGGASSKQLSSATEPGESNAAPRIVHISSNNQGVATNGSYTNGTYLNGKGSHAQAAVPNSTALNPTAAAVVNPTLPPLPPHSSGASSLMHSQVAALMPPVAASDGPGSGIGKVSRTSSSSSLQRDRDAAAMEAAVTSGGVMPVALANGAVNGSVVSATNPELKRSKLSSASATNGKTKNGHVTLLVDLVPEKRATVAAGGLIRPQEPGTVLMLGVAVMWAITASLDKVGVLHSPSVWAYFALQRLVIGLLSLAFQLSSDPRAFYHFLNKPLLLLTISVLELMAVVFFLEAIKYVFVSYVVAIKRSNILFSTMLGAVLFKENILRRLPYVLLMIVGMTMVVIEPHATYHAVARMSSHTRL